MTLLLLALACGGPPRAQETWELLGLDQAGGLLDLRLSVSDTGLLRGAGRSRLAWVRPRALPLEYGRLGAPEEVEARGGGGLQVGPDRLAPGADGQSWEARARAEDFDLRLRLMATGPAATPATRARDGREWEVEAPVTRGRLTGFIAAGMRRELVDGEGLLLRRRGDDPPALRGAERVGVYVLAPDLSLGVDQTGGEALSWALVGDRLLEHAPALVTRSPEGGFVLDYRPSADVVVRLTPRAQPRLASAPLDHLSRLERWFVDRVWGRPVRRLRAGRAQVVVAGLSREAQAISVVVGYE